MLKSRYIYPAIFHYEEDGISVRFPNLQGAFTCANTTEEALEMSKQCMGLHLYGMEKDNDEIPPPSDPRNIKTEENELIMMIDVWMPIYREDIENVAMKVTTTIPQWLKRLADENKLSYSNLLQKAIKEHLGIDVR